MPVTAIHSTTVGLAQRVGVDALDEVDRARRRAAASTDASSSGLDEHLVRHPVQHRVDVGDVGDVGPLGCRPVSRAAFRRALASSLVKVIRSVPGRSCVSAGSPARSGTSCGSARRRYCRSASGGSNAMRAVVRRAAVESLALGGPGSRSAAAPRRSSRFGGPAKSVGHVGCRAPRGRSWIGVRPVRAARRGTRPRRCRDCLMDCLDGAARDEVPGQAVFLLLGPVEAGDGLGGALDLVRLLLAARGASRRRAGRRGCGLAGPSSVRQGTSLVRMSARNSRLMPPARTGRCGRCAARCGSGTRAGRSGSAGGTAGAG